MATQISSAQNQVELKIPSTMRAVVYRGINDMRVETVPVPAIGRGRTAGPDCHLRHLRDRPEEDPLRLAFRAAHFRPRDVGNHRRCWRGRHLVPHRRSASWCIITFPATSATTAAREPRRSVPLYKKTGVTAGFEPSGGGFAEYIRVMDFVVDATAGWCAFRMGFRSSRLPLSSR